MSYADLHILNVHGVVLSDPAMGKNGTERMRTWEGRMWRGIGKGNKGNQGFIQDFISGGVSKNRGGGRVTHGYTRDLHTYLLTWMLLCI